MVLPFNAVSRLKLLVIVEEDALLDSAWLEIALLDCAWLDDDFAMLLVALDMTELFVWLDAAELLIAELLAIELTELIAAELNELKAVALEGFALEGLALESPMLLGALEATERLIKLLIEELPRVDALLELLIIVGALLSALDLLLSALDLLLSALELLLAALLLVAGGDGSVVGSLPPLPPPQADRMDAVTMDKHKRCKVFMM